MVFCLLCSDYCLILIVFSNQCLVFLRQLAKTVELGGTWSDLVQMAPVRGNLVFNGWIGEEIYDWNIVRPVKGHSKNAKFPGEFYVLLHEQRFDFNSIVRV